jgi:hypothetical protein
MFGLKILGTSLLAINGKDYSFKDPRLQLAVEVCRDAQQLALEGETKEACNEFISGIMMGRSTVQRLIEEKQEDSTDLSEDDSEKALDWLVSSYISVFKARITLEDWDTARADAWAACNYSMNTNLEALYCMLLVCRETEDPLGEIQTLRLILSVPVSSQSSFSEYFLVDKIKMMTTDEIQEQIQVLEKILAGKSSST